jgi:GNAT superfamily N-acetyltransferase
MLMKIDYEFHATLPTDAGVQQALLHLLATALESSPTELAADLAYQQLRSPVQLWLAWVAGKMVGCKLGYERKPQHYYSWLGGVEPALRGNGIARELLRQQHLWCRQQGCHYIRTHTYNRWRAMLLLNLREGFDIVGTVQERRGLVLVLEKKLE